MYTYIGLGLGKDLKKFMSCGLNFTKDPFGSVTSLTWTLSVSCKWRFSITQKGTQIKSSGAMNSITPQYVFRPVEGFMSSKVRGLSDKNRCAESFCTIKRHKSIMLQVRGADIPYQCFLEQNVVIALFKRER